MLPTILPVLDVKVFGAMAAIEAGGNVGGNFVQLLDIVVPLTPPRRNH